MKSFVISENRESYLGMKLAGIQGVYVQDEEGIAAAFKAACSDPEIGIIYLTEKAFNKIPNQVAAAKRRALFPLVTVIPDRHGYERKQGLITQYIKESVGL